MGSLAYFNNQLGRYICDYGTSVFVETGTGRGDGVRRALNFQFKKIYSIEVHPVLAFNAQQMFATTSQVCVIHSDSITAFKTLLSEIESPILFWLDAHYPGADAGFNRFDDEPNDEIRLPLERELELIRDIRKDGKDVLLIDDLRIYRMDPSVIAHPELIPRHSFSSSEFWAKILSNTHNCQVIEEHDIYCVLTPNIRL